MKASVIILNWNGNADDCIEACESALNQSYPDKEVLFVDNGSTNGSSDLVAQALPSVRLLRTDKNLGVAGGRNFGADAATGDLLFFLENDGKWDSDDLIGDVVELLESDPEIGALYTKVIGYTHGELQSAPFSPDSPLLTPVANFSGGASVIRSEVFERCGKFPTDFFRQGEERFFALLAYEVGYKICYWRKHSLLHKGSSYTGKNLVVRRLNFEHELKTVARLFPDSSYRTFFFMKLGAWILRLLIDGDLRYLLQVLPKISIWLRERNSYPHISPATLALTEALIRGDYAHIPGGQFSVADAKRSLGPVNVVFSNFKRWAIR